MIRVFLASESKGIVSVRKVDEGVDSLGGDWDCGGGVGWYDGNRNQSVVLLEHDELKG